MPLLDPLIKMYLIQALVHAEGVLIVVGDGTPIKEALTMQLSNIYQTNIGTNNQQSNAHYKKGFLEDAY